MIVDGESGALVAPGNTGALLDRIRELEGRQGFLEMRAKARQRFLAEYTGERNFSLLVNIYQGAMCSGSSVYPVPASPGTCPL
jgi:hypothetical protein